MVNEQKVLQMTKMAVYESGEGRKDKAVSGYFRGDYIGLQMILSFLVITAAFAAVAAAYVCFNFEELMADIYTMDLVEMGRSVLGPECESSHLLTEGCGAENAIMTQWIDEDTYAFLCRTFFNIRFYGRMGRLVEYLMSLPAHEGGAASAYALLRGKELTVVIVSGGKLLCANYFRCRGGYDAAYYILSALHTLGLDLASTHICAGGDGFAALAEELGRFAPQVSRLEPPALPYRTGRTTLDAPFDLLIFKPCE